MRKRPGVIGMFNRIAFAVLLFSLPLSVAAQTSEAAPPAFTPHVFFSIDAPDELTAQLKDHLKKELAKLRVIRDEKNPQWNIVIVGMEPEGATGDAKRFVLACGYVQNVTYVDPTVIEQMRRTGYVPPQQLRAPEKKVTTQMLQSMSVYEGKWSELDKTVAEIVHGLDLVCLQPARRVSAQRR